MKDLRYEHQSIFPCGGGSNLILGTVRENQIFFLKTQATVKFFFTKLSKNNMGVSWGVSDAPRCPMMGGIMVGHMTPSMLFLFLEKKTMHLIGKIIFVLRKK